MGLHVVQSASTKKAKRVEHVTVTHYDGHGVAEALEDAYHQKSTGRIVIHLSQGSPGAVELEQGESRKT